MSAKAHFRVVGRLNNAARITSGTVTIHRGAGLFAVRPRFSRRVFELPLSTVADMVVARIIRAEVFAKRLEKAKRRGTK